MSFVLPNKNKIPPKKWPIEYVYYDEVLNHYVTRYKSAYAPTDDLPLEEIPE